jgi:hypothetical protein
MRVSPLEALKMLLTNAAYFQQHQPSDAKKCFNTMNFNVIKAISISLMLRLKITVKHSA